MARSKTAGDTSSTDTASTGTARRRQTTNSRLENLDYPRAADDIDSSSEGSDSDESTDSVEEAGREESRSAGQQPKKEARTMHSWPKWTGVQGTQMKHLLSGGNTTTDNSPTLNQDLEEKDLESLPTKAETNRRQNEKAMSLKRKIYIVGTVALGLVLIVIGIVLGRKAVREREELAAKGFSPALAADHALLVAQGDEMQAHFGGKGVSVDHSKDEVHQIAEYGVEESHETGEAEEAVLEDDNAATFDSSDLAKIAIPISSTAGVPLPIPTSSVPHSKTPIVTATDPALVHQSFPDLQNLFEGNERFINETNSDSPGLLQKLGLGQTPKFATLGCSDSRVSETLITGSKVGDLFVTRNIGNQYLIDSLSTESVFSYAISHLGVSHLIVLGHTKCGAVLASIVPESKATMDDIGENRIMTWVRPIRSLYLSSARSEIVDFRESMKKKKEVTAEDVTSTVWNALIEENVKAQVKQMSTDPSVLKSWKKWGEGQIKSNSTTSAGEKEKRSATSFNEAPIELWIHGWVYDVSTGLVHDLGVSVGPRMK